MVERGEPFYYIFLKALYQSFLIFENLVQKSWALLEFNEKWHKAIHVLGKNQ